MIEKGHPVTAPEAARDLYVHAETARKRFKELEDADLVKWHAKARFARTGDTYRLEGDGLGWAMAISLGHENARCAIGHEGMPPEEFFTGGPEPAGAVVLHDPKHGLESLRAVVEEALGKFNLRAAAPPLETTYWRGITFSLPAPVERDAHGSNQAVKFSESVLRQWGSLPIKPYLRDNGVLPPALREVPILAANDVNMQALAELEHGEAQGASDFIAVKSSGGFGAAIVMDGELRTGAGGRSGEIGHVGWPAWEPNPRHEPLPPCPSCGEPGHLEGYLSARSLIDRLAAPEPNGDPGGYSRQWEKVKDVLADPAHPDHRRFKTEVECLAVRLGEVVSQLGLLFDPEFILLTGVLVDLNELLTGPLEDHLASRRVLDRDPPAVRLGGGGRMSARGGVLYALRETRAEAEVRWTEILDAVGVR